MTTSWLSSSTTTRRETMRMQSTSCWQQNTRRCTPASQAQHRHTARTPHHSRRSQFLLPKQFTAVARNKVRHAPQRSTAFFARLGVLSAKLASREPDRRLRFSATKNAKTRKMNKEFMYSTIDTRTKLSPSDRTSCAGATPTTTTPSGFACRESRRRVAWLDKSREHARRFAHTPNTYKSGDSQSERAQKSLQTCRRRRATFGHCEHAKSLRRVGVR